MSLNDIIRNAVAVADAITKDLQGTVMHSAWISQDGFGKATYGRIVQGLTITSTDPSTPDIPAPRECIIELKQREKQVQGRNVMTHAHLTVVGPIAFNGMGNERKEAVDTRDVFVLPDGSTGPVVDVQGVVDSETGLMYAVEIWLGDLTRSSSGGAVQ